MPRIIPIRDLRDTTKISEMCNASNDPIFVTKNGYGDMVVMSMEAYENLQFESEIYYKLLEAEREAEMSDVRYTTEDVMTSVKKLLEGLGTNEI